MMPHDRVVRSASAPRRLDRRIPALIASLLTAAIIGCTGAEGPAGPAGGGTDLLTALGTGSLVLDASVLGYTPVPGLSNVVTVPPGGSTALLVETDGGVQIGSADPAAFCFTDVALFVDGVQAGPGRRTVVFNSADVGYAVGSYGFSVTTAAAAGTHSISVMARAVTPLAAVSCYVGAGSSGSGLPGNPHLQGVLNVLVLR